MPDISALVEQFPYMGLFALLILGGIGLPFPEDATLMLCGFLISHDVVKLIPALAVVYPGLLLADYFLYYVGKKYGRMIVTNKRFHRIISSERLLSIEEQYSRGSNRESILLKTTWIPAFAGMTYTGYYNAPLCA